MIHLHPDRAPHELFTMPVFCSPEFIEFRTNMATLLNDNVNPLDLTLQSMLPAIHDRFTMVQNEIGAGFRILEQKHSDKLDTLYNHLQAIQDCQRRNLMDVFHNAFQSAANISVVAAPRSPGAASTVPAARTPNLHIAAMPQEHHQSPVVTTNSHIFGYTYRLPPSPSSVTEMWDAWFGLGEYEDKPIPGGVAQMNVLHKARWRTAYKGHERKHFSRYNVIVKTISHLVEGGRELQCILAEFDELFVTDAKSSISTFGDIIRDKGYRVVIGREPPNSSAPDDE